MTRLWLYAEELQEYTETHSAIHYWSQLILQLKMIKLFEKLHIPLWIVKDTFWMLGLGWYSLAFALPTIILSIVLVWFKRGNEKLMELMMGFWLTANTLWMCHEQFHTDTQTMALAMFLCGLIVFPFYLLLDKEV